MTALCLSFLLIITLSGFIGAALDAKLQMKARDGTLSCERFSIGSTGRVRLRGRARGGARRFAGCVSASEEFSDVENVLKQSVKKSASTGFGGEREREKKKAGQVLP